MQGEWATHPKYGEQFRVVHYKSLVPASVFGIEKYLGSGLIKGIGPIMAKRIVKTFGKETLDIIEQETDKLAGVEGIGKKRLEMIKKAWADQKEIRHPSKTCHLLSQENGATHFQTTGHLTYRRRIWPESAPSRKTEGILGLYRLKLRPPSRRNLSKYGHGSFFDVYGRMKWSEPAPTDQRQLKLPADDN